jgi:secreted trypsin-like serine protease
LKQFHLKGLSMSNGKSRAVKAFLCLATLSLSACSSDLESMPSTSKIVQGHAAEALSYPVVALLKMDASGIWYSYCSGVMITAERLLTAAHCTQNAAGELYEPAAVRVQWGVNDPEAHAETALPVRSLNAHPRFDTAAMRKDKDGLVKPADAYDIALWTLEQPIAHPAFQAAMIFPETELGASLQQEQEIFLLGYGQKEAWESPWEKHVLMVATTAYKPLLSWNVRRREVVDGRMMTRTVQVEFSAFSPTEFYAGDRGLPDTCKGDSGGPALMKDSSGQWKLLGLTSRGDANCDRGGVYTLVPAMQSWFENL